jgi:hypothetical protein
MVPESLSPYLSVCPGLAVTESLDSDHRREKTRVTFGVTSCLVHHCMVAQTSSRPLHTYQFSLRPAH